MAYRKIVTIAEDEAFLRKKSRPVERFDERLSALLDDMKEALVREHGAGLAAVQIGVLRRIAVVDPDGAHYVELINPEILETEGEQCGAEGCLSVPGQARTVRRPKRCKVRAKDRFGREFTMEADDFFCRAICHECDHLDGILYLDRAERRDPE